MFNLLFLIVALAFVVIIVVATIQMLRGRFKQARWLLVRYGIGLAIYLGIVAVVGLLSPQRIVALKEDRCFDDWCIAVDEFQLTPELGQGADVTKANGIFYVVTLRVSNHARGREQRASSVAVHLLDSQGRRYDLSPKGQQAFERVQGSIALLTASLSVGQSLTTFQVFDLPQDAQNVVLTVEHPVGFSPGLFVIGDEASLLHKPTIVRLAQRRG